MNIVNDTPELRARIDAHNAEAIALHLPTATVTWIDTKVESISSNDVIHEHREKANSWNRNYYNMLAMSFLPSAGTSSTFGDGKLNYKDSSGSISSPSGSQFSPWSLVGSNQGPQWGGALGDAGFGIGVGTGTTPEDFNDVVLQTKVQHGTGSGQLSYQGGILGTATYNSQTKKWTQTISRIFNNNSSSDINISETAIYILCGNIYGNPSKVMIERNLLATPVTVPAAYKLTVTYTTEMTFPA